MTRKSRDDDVLARMRAANPFSAAELREAIADAELTRAMRRAIAAGESPAQPIPAGDRVAREHVVRTRSGRNGIFSRHRGASLGLGGIVGVAVIAALILLSGGSVRDGAHPTFAAAAVEVAEANPRLLVTAPGWSILHARSFEVDSGELIYGDGEHPAYGPGGRQLDLTWYPVRFYRSMLRDHSRVRTRAGHPRPVTSTLLGQRATTFAYSGQHPNYTTIFSPEGNVFIAISGSFGSRQEYEALLHSLRRVGVDAWLEAMPPEVIRPAARSQAIAQMLQGLPVPPGFDPATMHFRDVPVPPGSNEAALQSESALTDRFMLGKAVAGAVACDWIQRWLSATRSGDGAAAREAVEAMGTAAHWPVLLQMVREKGYREDALPPNGRGWPSNILAAAHEIAGGHLRRKPAVITIQVKGHPVGYMTPAGAAPASVLGCF
jgi:hypothetical protein